MKTFCSQEFTESFVAIESLNLVMRIEPIVRADKPMTKDLVIQEYPFFGKLGRLQGSYHIKLKEPADPFLLIAQGK